MNSVNSEKREEIILDHSNIKGFKITTNGKQGDNSLYISIFA